MEPFCTVAQYRLRYPADETPDEVLNEVLLDATDVMCAQMDESDVAYTDTSESFTRRLMRICREVVHRSIGEGTSDDMDVPFGATELSQAADTFNASVKLGNPYGDLFLTQAEKDALGIGAAHACVIGMFGQVTSGERRRGGSGGGQVEPTDGAVELNVVAHINIPDLDYESMPVSQLAAIARKLGFDVPRDATKADILAILRG